MNFVVVALSLLHLRGVRQAPSAMTVDMRLNSRQWSVVRRLEKMLDAWLMHPLVTSESMGRNAAKIEELDSVLGQLEAVLVDSFPSGVYARPGREHIKQGQTDADVVRLGRSSASLGSTFKQLDPDRIAFVFEPRFDPAPCLDQRGRDVFLHPLKESLDPGEYFGPVPPVQVHVADGKRDDFLPLLDGSGNSFCLGFSPRQGRQQGQIDHGFAEAKSARKTFGKVDSQSCFRGRAVQTSIASRRAASVFRQRCPGLYH